MSTAEAKPVIVHIDRSTPPGCISFATAEADRRGCGLVVRAIGAMTTSARHELAAVRVTHPLVATIVETSTENRLDAALVVTGGPHAAVAAESTGRPLMVFRPTLAPAAPPPPVVVAIDIEPANNVLEFAFAEALLRTTSVRGIYIPHRLDDEVDPAIESSLRETLDRWADKYPGVPAWFTAVAGLDAAVALTVASRSAQLVVIGAADADGPASVGQAVVRRAGCPVAIIA